MVRIRVTLKKGLKAVGNSSFVVREGRESIISSKQFDPETMISLGEVSKDSKPKNQKKKATFIKAEKKVPVKRTSVKAPAPKTVKKAVKKVAKKKVVLKKEEKKCRVCGKPITQKKVN